MSGQDPFKANWFDWLSFFIVMGLLAWALLGCNPCKRLARKCPPQVIVKDSIREIRTVEVRDCTVFVPGETLRDTIQLECDSAGNVVYIYRERPGISAALTTRIDSNRLFIRSDCPELRETIKGLNKKLETREVKTEYRKEIHRVKYVPPWIYFVMAAALGIILFASLRFILRLRRL